MSTVSTPYNLDTFLKVVGSFLFSKRDRINISEHLVRSLPGYGAMPSFFVVPLVVAIVRHSSRGEYIFSCFFSTIVVSKLNLMLWAGRLRLF